MLSTKIQLCIILIVITSLFPSCRFGQKAESTSDTRSIPPTSEVQLPSAKSIRPSLKESNVPSGQATTGTKPTPIKIVSYDISQFNRLMPLMRNESKDKEELWEVAEVIFSLNADILAITEGPKSTSDLKEFNQRWLMGIYNSRYIKSYRSRDRKSQRICVMLKPGFKIIDEEKHIRYPFSRGPIGLKIKPANGDSFWLYIVHLQAKTGGREAAELNNKQAEELSKIIAEKLKSGDKNIILLGNFNNHIGQDRYPGGYIENPERESISYIESVMINCMSEQQEEGLFTEHDMYKNYFHNKRNFRPNVPPRSNPELVDLIFISPEIENSYNWKTEIFQGSLSWTASDHFPVVLELTPK